MAMATFIRPHTASRASRTSATSPARPPTSHSTIRRVTPSPESLSEALDHGFVAHSTPLHHNRALNTGAVEANALGAGLWTTDVVVSSSPSVLSPPTTTDPPTQIYPDRLKSTKTFALTRIPKPTASSKIPNSRPSRNQANCVSPKAQLYSVSLRKHRPMSTPTRHPSKNQVQEKALSGSVSLRSPKTIGIGDEQGEKGSREPFTMLPGDDPFVSTSTEKDNDSNEITPTPKHTFHPPLHTPRKSRPSKSSTSSPKPYSKHPRSPSITIITPSTRPHLPTFSTPGRDEMERKNGRLETFTGDQGPFGRAKGMQDLNERRRRVSNAKKEWGGVEEDGREKDCGCRCVVM